MQLREESRSADDQHDDSNDRCQPAGVGPVPGIFDHGLDGPGAVLTDQALNLIEDVTLSRLLSEQDAGDRNGDDQ